jgi:hypothetical protein
MATHMCNHRSDACVKIAHTNFKNQGKQLGATGKSRSNAMQAHSSNELVPLYVRHNGTCKTCRHACASRVHVFQLDTARLA